MSAFEVQPGFENVMSYVKSLQIGLPPPPPRQPRPVIEVFASLQKELNAFEAKLDDQHEVAIRISGGSTLIHVRTVRFDAPNVLIFEGLTPEGNETVAVQHVAQLNLQIVKVAKISATAFRVGFIQPTPVEEPDQASP